ncbi:PTS mannitol transporter subunit IICB [Staphylococcus warneri]|uniref:PTS mannitol transporter subunit IICB n=1 Tax=Staphylococcus warneri TaxID=1292 RepID=UPI0002AD9579|nr:PTS mannitol transporter subunit IICB [Staphylococcus warneri]AGC90062.1 PTS system mannitol-specific transporter subunit IIB [Staphylococcus warneri SG1]KEK49410.1 PTS system mannitol-specific EIICB component [Staphylococcus warneri Lyso 1 2011]KEK55710.1 PTS system mannitol-specific EIICB component [Staphylococcus warneri Lyso 2 2011]MCE5013071.1 PTS mannitol transporter subunit IICB [Staphylococcus warneri]MCM3052703.1 PTS mannitol transporter subunit IICB [Staphylococcus warneri]
MAQTQEKKGFGRKVQAFGSFLSSMIMPNIGAFIAWGFIAAIFIDNGWLPNKDLAQLADPMIKFLIPLLIAFSGGRLIHGLRGGIIAATSTMGVIVALPDTPMLLGAMIMGPLVGWLMKKTDEIVQPRTPQGFEMLFNNFSAGILGFIMTILSFEILAPIMKFIMHILSVAVEALVHAHLLPIVSIIVEPAKIVFLNNAINHGVFTPLGADQAATAGQSILYAIESNPGPGFGVLLAYMIFGKGTAKATSYGAGIIHFLGGIHEIYFPYVLMRPMLFISVILGGMTGVATYQATGFGFKSPASPGSFIVYCINAPRGEFLHMLLGVVLATLVSFAVSAIILKFTKEPKQDLEAATAQMEATKGKKSSVSSKLSSKENNQQASTTGATAGATSTEESNNSEDDADQLLDNYNTEDVDAHDYSNVNHVIFACDAGMGSSAMGASMLRNKFKKAGISDVNVTNTAINQLPNDAQLVITQKTLTDRAIKQVPNAIHISVDNFLNSPRYEELLNNLKKEQ